MILTLFKMLYFVDDSYTSTGVLEADFSRCSTMLSPELRHTIHSALAYPEYSYVRAKGEEESDWYDSTAALYKLYMGCGKYINIMDLFESFKFEYESHHRPKVKGRNNKKEEEEKRIMAEFIRSLTTLHFLGFIKVTNRRSDHVQRLVWIKK
jgi:Origin recognition complex winged helix C-terminal